MRTALTRPPGPEIARCELTYLERVPIDPGAAAAEHLALERALAGQGCRVLRLPPLPDCPDGTFVEDVAIVLDEIAIVTRPGAPSRRPETAAMEAVLTPFRPVRRIREPGTLDGGDVVRRGRTLYVGRSTRTNDDGIAQLRRELAPFGYSVEAVDVRGCLHLKSAACAIGDDVVLVNRAWVDPARLGEADVIDADAAEPFAANVLDLHGVLLMAAEHPRTRGKLEARGHKVHPTPLAQLAKAEAGVTCCCILIE